MSQSVLFTKLLLLINIHRFCSFYAYKKICNLIDCLWWKLSFTQIVIIVISTLYVTSFSATQFVLQQNFSKKDSSKMLIMRRFILFGILLCFVRGNLRYLLMFNIFLFLAVEGSTIEHCGELTTYGPFGFTQGRIFEIKPVNLENIAGMIYQ